MDKIKKIRARLFPASSKYFGSEMSQIKAMLENLSEENRQLRELVEYQNKNQEVITKKIDLYSLQIYRKENESNFDARVRLFSSLPEATGVLALYQSVNTKLLKALSDICDRNNLDYWLWSGSAVAVAGRGKAIPWDDDIDVCMMRDDFKKLLKKIKHSKDYQVTIVYDFLSRNRQYRFVSRRPDIYNFIDIVVCDWCTDNNKKLDAIYKALEREMEEELISSPELEYWRTFNYFFTEGSRFTYQPMSVDMANHDQKRANALIKKIDPIFEKYIQKAHSMNILCDKKSAKAVAYGLDNLFNAPKRKDIWSRNVIFPTHMSNYENISVRMPHLEKEFCEICFPGWPYIPNDICSHNHMPNDIQYNTDSIIAMSNFINRQD